MLIRSHDAGDETQSRQLLAEHDFGQLIAAGAGRAVPVVVPTHFVFDGHDTIVLHLATPNPVWTAIDENPMVVLTVIADWAYVPSDWNAAPESDSTYGIPTSYYASVQAICEATPLDDPGDLTSILVEQLGHFQPEGGHGGFEEPGTPYQKSLPAIRGLRLDIQEFRGKFKFGGNKDEHHRGLIADKLEERNGPADASAASRTRPAT
jgi:transcriptional regulator